MIAVVVTAYKPDAGFQDRFSGLLASCDVIVVSDNTPAGRASAELPPGFVHLRHGRNLGLGPALNAGIAAARAAGAQVVMLFDQDSTPSIAFFDALISRAEEIRKIASDRIVIGPAHVDDQATTREAVVRSEASNAKVTCLPTSGMVFRLEDLGPDDLFDEELFLDLVDFEWCWRLGAKGWSFFRALDIPMSHRLGEAQRKFLGLTYHVPAPYRHYFQVRDTPRLALRRYVPMYAKLRLVGVLPVKALFYPFILDRGLERLGWMLRGMVDAMRGIHGVGAAGRRLSA